MNQYTDFEGNWIFQDEYERLSPDEKLRWFCMDVAGKKGKDIMARNVY